MSQNPLKDSGTQSSKIPGLKPPLAGALASLEVQLDQELARYRRTRAGARTVNQPRGNYVSNPSQPLTAMTTKLETIQSSIASVKTNAPPASYADTFVGEPGSATVKTEGVDSLNLPPISESSKTQNPPPSPKPPSSIVPTSVQAKESENISQPDDAPTQPNDYLESSEALLRSLTEEQPQTTKKPVNSSDSLLSPLGIGSMLLLLMASLTVSYIVFNPKILSQINLSKLFNSSSSPVANQSQGSASPSLPQPESRPTPIPKHPNLAAGSFPTVRDANDVVALQPKVQPTPAPLPNSVALQPKVQPTPAPLPNSVALQPKVQPTPAPLPNSIALPKPVNTPNPIAVQNPIPPLPINSPSPTAQPNTEIKPSADGFYHLVIDNQSDGTLAKTRQVVSDAYLSPDNKLIYLAALKTKQQVQQRLQELKSQGIEARIKQP